MKNIFKVAIFFIVLIGFSGCSTKILLPYEECPECVKGTGEGYCGSLTDVYNVTKDKK